MKNQSISQPASMNKAWTPEEDQMLISLIKRGSDTVTISSILGRTRASIMNRKFNLGIEERIKRSPKGTGEKVPLSFRKIERGSSKKVEAPKAKEKAKVKVNPTVKEKTTVYKALYIHRNMRRGDITEIAKRIGVAISHVSSVLNGTYENETILDLAYTFFIEREKREKVR
jgi:hypothetical protein